MAKTMELDGGAGKAFRPLEIDPAMARQTTPTTAELRAEAMEPAATRHELRVDMVAAPPAAKGGGGVRRMLLAAVAIAVVGGAGHYGYQWWTNGRFIVSTDDAYVSADTSTVTSKVAGYVKSVPAPDNSHVKAGDPLVVLDDADSRIALAQAEGQIATGEAAIARIGQQIVAGEASVRSAEAEFASAKAAAGNAVAQYGRVNTLAGKQFATTSALDSARTGRDQADQAVAAAEAAVAAAARQRRRRHRPEDRGRAFTRPVSARPRPGEARSRPHGHPRAVRRRRRQSRRASRASTCSPASGCWRWCRSTVYVDANFKETQLADMQPGQTRHGDRRRLSRPIAIEGTVESVAPASGSVFSLLPPDNATGNFTKIVQRVPVRIASAR